MNRPLTVAVAAAVGLSAGVVADVLDQPDTARALGPGPVTVEVGIEHSAFDIDGLTVRRGTTVEFVVRNHDPIGHELIVGDDAVHDRHRNGTEARHPPVPGEVSIDAGRTGATVYTFDRTGTVEYACHLPGHYDYGMRGEITVVD